MLSSSKTNRIQERELRAYGSAGGYVGRGTDVQASAAFAGERPAQLGDRWGYHPEVAWGTLFTAAGAVQVRPDGDSSSRLGVSRLFDSLTLAPLGTGAAVQFARIIVATGAAVLVLLQRVTAA